jgi:hypothetical protein
MGDLPMSRQVERDERIYRARDLLLEYLTAHERTCADPQCRMASGVAAFIAHSLGVAGSVAINTMEAELERYNVECPHCTERN